MLFSFTRFAEIFRRELIVEQIVLIVNRTIFLLCNYLGDKNEI